MVDLEYFSEEIKLIQSVKVRRLVELTLQHAPPGFWTDASSSSSKYHPPQSQGRQGLLRHVKSMAKFAIKLCDVYSCTVEETDAVIAATLLHDVAKRGILWGKHTIPTHDAEGYIFIKRVVTKFELNDVPLLDEILNSVLWHYGKWSKRAEGVELKDFRRDYSTVMQIVHIADVMSADKDVHRYSLETSLVG